MKNIKYSDSILKLAIASLICIVLGIIPSFISAIHYTSPDNYYIFSARFPSFAEIIFFILDLVPSVLPAVYSATARAMLMPS